MPARVPAQAKELIVGLVDDAVRAGGSHSWACSLLGVSDDRAHRWRRRLRDTGALADRPARRRWRCTRSDPQRSRRSSTSANSGGRWTAAIASSLTGAPDLLK